MITRVRIRPFAEWPEDHRRVRDEYVKYIQKLYGFGPPRLKEIVASEIVCNPLPLAYFNGFNCGALLFRVLRSYTADGECLEQEELNMSLCSHIAELD